MVLDYVYWAGDIIADYMETEEGRIKVFETIEEICPERMISNVMGTALNGAIYFHEDDDAYGVGILSADEMHKIASSLEYGYENTRWCIKWDLEDTSLYLCLDKSHPKGYRWSRFLEAEATKFYTRYKALSIMDKFDLTNSVLEKYSIGE